MKNESKIKCPMCDGCGKIKKPNDIAEKQQIIKANIIHLQTLGWSIRQIAKQYKFKSPSTVAYYLNK